MDYESYGPRRLREVPDFILNNLVLTIREGRDQELDGLCQAVSRGAVHPLEVNQFQLLYGKMQAELRTLVGELRRLIEKEFSSVSSVMLTADAVAQLSVTTAGFALSKHVNGVEGQLYFFGVDLGNGDFVSNMRRVIMEVLCSSQASAWDLSVTKGMC